MKLMLLGIAASQNKTGTDLIKLFADSSEEKGLTKKD